MQEDWRARYLSQIFSSNTTRNRAGATSSHRVHVPYYKLPVHASGAHTSDLPPSRLVRPYTGNRILMHSQQLRVRRRRPNRRARYVGLSTGICIAERSECGTVEASDGGGSSMTQAKTTR